VRCIVLAYFSAFVTLIGAVIGLMGPAWNEEETGLKRLTARGRLSVIVLAVGTVLTIAATANARAAAEFDRHQREVVKAAAYLAIDETCVIAARPFVQFYEQMTRQRLDESSPSSLMAVLESGIAERLISSVDVERHMPSGSAPSEAGDVVIREFDDLAAGATYGNVLMPVIAVAPRSLVNIVQIYSYYLDGEDLVNLAELNRTPLMDLMSFYTSKPEELISLFRLNPEPFSSWVREYLRNLQVVWSKIRAWRIQHPGLLVRQDEP
jgi:hypothetical protein